MNCAKCGLPVVYEYGVLMHEDGHRACPPGFGTDAEAEKQERTDVRP